MSAGVLTAAPAAAGPTVCDYPSCTPGIRSGVVLGAPCEETSFYVFGVTDWGRLVFCGSPRRYEPRWFRAPVMYGVKEENSNCPARDGAVAQGFDGMFLTCTAAEGASRWLRGST